MKRLQRWYQRRRFDDSPPPAGDVVRTASDQLQQALERRWWLWRKHFLEAKQIEVEQRMSKRRLYDPSVTLETDAESVADETEQDADTPHVRS